MPLASGVSCGPESESSDDQFVDASDLAAGPSSPLKMDCGCEPFVSQAPEHGRHKTKEVGKCYECVKDIVSPGKKWKDWYKKYAHLPEIVNLRRSYRKSFTGDPSDAHVVMLYNCAVHFLDLRVRTFVRIKFGDEVLGVLEEIHRGLKHK